jgi:hypothetical protein
MHTAIWPRPTAGSGPSSGGVGRVAAHSASGRHEAGRPAESRVVAADPASAPPCRRRAEPGATAGRSSVASSQPTQRLLRLAVAGRSPAPRPAGQVSRRRSRPSVCSALPSPGGARRHGRPVRAARRGGRDRRKLGGRWASRRSQCQRPARSRPAGPSRPSWRPRPAQARGALGESPLTVPAAGTKPAGRSEPPVVAAATGASSGGHGWPPSALVRTTKTPRTRRAAGARGSRNACSRAAKAT